MLDNLVTVKLVKSLIVMSSLHDFDEKHGRLQIGTQQIVHGLRDVTREQKCKPRLKLHI